MMKRIALLLMVLLGANGFAPGQGSEGSQIGELLREALFAEEADRDLAKAEKGYREILRRYEEDRAYSATAMLRLGEVLKKRGENTAADELFSRVLREFSDQEAVAKIAAARLGGKAAGLVRDPRGKEIDRLQKMLEESPDLLNATVGGKTPLERAAGEGESEVVNYLLAQGAEVKGSRSPYNDYGSGKVVRTALGRAVAGGYPEVVDLLIAAGAPLVDGMLHTAASTGNRAVTERLLDAGADPNQRFAAGGFIDNPSAIIAANLPPSPQGVRPPSPGRPKEDPNLTPLEIATKKGFGAVARLLLDKGAKPVPRDDQPSFALLFAVESGDADLVTALLESGADADSKWKGANRREDGSSALHLAAGRGDGEIVRILLAAGADVSAVTTAKRTALHHAMGEPVDILLAAGIDPNSRGHRGSTPLFYTAGPRGRGEAKARALLEAGADPNAVSDGGYTVLMNAVGTGSLAIVKLLMERGADVSHSSEAGTALGFAAQSGISPEDAARYGVDRADTIIEALVEGGADPNQSAADGQTPLYIATGRLLATNIEALLKAGADPNHIGEGGFPPLTALPGPDHHTSRNPAKVETQQEAFGEAVRLLLEACADPDVRDAEGYAAIEKAALRNYGDVLRFLLSKGTSVNLGKQPVYELIQGDAELRALLFRQEQLQAEDRGATIRVVFPAVQELAVISAFVEEGKALPHCRHSLFEIYGFYAALQPATATVSVWRMGSDEPMALELGKLLSTGDASADVPLQWGDVVEFSSTSEHGEQTITGEARELLEKHLSRTIEFVRKDEEGAEVMRRKITFFPGSWGRVGEGRNWMPARHPLHHIIADGVDEVSKLVPVRGLGWKEGERDCYPKRWVVMRGGGDGEARTFSILNGSNSSYTALPQDGDVISFEGGVQTRLGPPPPSRVPTRASGRRVTLPPRGR